MNMNAIYLKVKAKHLAAEARIIRKEEGKLIEKGKGKYATYLAEHRRGVLRMEARATSWARAFLQGKTIVEIEGFNKVDRALEDQSFNSIDFDRTAKRALTMINKYGGRGVTENQFKDWLTS